MESIAVFLMLLVVFLNPFPHTTFLDQLFFYAAILPMIAMAQNKINGFYYKTPLLYPLVLFLFWAALSVVFAMDKPDSAHDLYSHLIRYLIFYLVVINLFTTKKRLLLLAACVVLSEFIFAAGGLILYYGILKHDIVSRFFVKGFKAIATDTIPFGFMFGLFLAVWLFKVCQNRCQRSFLAVAIMVLTISTIATQSRGAVLALCIAFPVQLQYHKKILSLLLLAIILAISLSPMQKRITFQHFKNNARRGLILYSIEIIKDSPVLGTGFSIDTFRNPKFIDKKTYLSRIPKKYGKIPFHRPHNMFLSMATRTGILGMVLYAGIFAVCIFVCCRLILYGKDLFIQSLSRCCLALLTMFLTNGMLQVMTTHFIDMIQFIIFALVTIVWKMNKENLTPAT
ncbi:O-antigen ligase family protein [uncultured Desulfobacter sp.]|uniref:O-antigen ligase family protein n=1 Tax=uncultured Desulfobacter sp. TaxID=240139 RepID=UPI0029F48601|nr:O-antigen ligase family protein [uncultured Desulfobacter sp.]